MRKTWLIYFGVMTCIAQAQARAQETPEPTPQDDVHQHHMAPESSGSWMFMNDGVLFATFNQQGSDRGQTEFKSQNWFMTMAQHRLGPGQLTLKAMFSAEPMTQTARGYSEIFQTGEAYQGLENVDYQHPHDLFMQLAAVWRIPLGDPRRGLTISGGPVGEATLGPPAFMHRQSAAENPTAPLAHHHLDSTHIASGVVATSVDVGPWVVEASAFHGREPDEHRYDITVGALDSWATRLIFRPSASWLAQVSYGFLKEPEELEPGDQHRITTSVSWTRTSGSNDFSLTAAVGNNRRIYDTNTTAFLTEATLHRSKNAVYTRVEVLQVTTEHLLFPTVVHRPHPGELIDVLGAYTGGYLRDLRDIGPLRLGVGADVTLYSVPDRLVSSPQIATLYGSNPVSFHVFVRIRPRAPAMGHMWNMMMPDTAMR